MAMIILIYPKYVGGKFISNCLALSKNCVVQDEKIAKMDLKLNSESLRYYDFKLQTVMKSLPNKGDLKKWGEYEYGCEELYGIDEQTYKQSSIKKLKDIVDNIKILSILKDKKESCLIAHDYRTAMKYLLVHRDAKIIEFRNFDKFRDLALSLKSDTKPDGYDLSRTYHYKDQEFFKLDSYMIDVDSTFFDQLNFTEMMKNLYDYLGFEDFNEVLLYSFYSAYMELHE